MRLDEIKTGDYILVKYVDLGKINVFKISSFSKNNHEELIMVSIHDRNLILNQEFLDKNEVFKIDESDYDYFYWNNQALQEEIKDKIQQYREKIIEDDKKRIDFQKEELYKYYSGQISKNDLIKSLLQL